MHEATTMLQTLVIALAAGTALLILAGRLRFPAIAPLLVCGVLIGPEGLGWVQPSSLGIGLEPLISLAVAIILFEGGLTLDIKGAKAAPAVIRRLVTLGALITWLGAAALCMAFLDVTPQTALLAGSLIIVTGPTVVTPLLRRIDVSERLHHVLHWEAVLIDPIGVFIALLCYEAIAVDSSIGGALAGLAVRCFSGAALGGVGGLAIGYVLKRGWIAREYINTGVLAAALLIYAMADRVLPHTGILAVTIAGFVLGWLNPPELDELKDFKLQITELAVAMIFVILAADLELSSFLALGKGGALVVLLVIVLLRPLVVFVATWGSQLTVRERMFASGRRCGYCCGLHGPSFIRLGPIAIRA
ncbi:MAG: cation:proton antiporter [Myxococcota bacterium]